MSSLSQERDVQNDSHPPPHIPHPVTEIQVSQKSLLSFNVYIHNALLNQLKNIFAYVF